MGAYSDVGPGSDTFALSAVVVLWMESSEGGSAKGEEAEPAPTTRAGRGYNPTLRRTLRPTTSTSAGVPKSCPAPKRLDGVPGPQTHKAPAAVETTRQQQEMLNGRFNPLGRWANLQAIPYGRGGSACSTCDRTTATTIAWPWWVVVGFSDKEGRLSWPP